MKLRNKSISTQITLNILITTSLVFILAIGTIAIFSHIIISKQATKLAQTKLDVSIKDMEYTMEPIEILSNNTAWLVENNINDSSTLIAITRQIVENNPDIVCSTIAFAPKKFDGKEKFALFSIRQNSTDSILSMNLDTSTYDYFAADWYKISNATKKSCWIDPVVYNDSVTQNIIASYSVPILDNNGDVVAIVSNSLTLDFIVDKLDSIKPFNESRIYLIGHNGYFITEDSNLLNTTMASFAKNLNNDSLYAISQDIANGKNGMKQFRYNNDVAFNIYAHLKNGWGISLFCLYGDVLSSAKLMNNLLFLVIIVAITILIITCHRRVRLMTQPIIELSVSAMNMGKGNFNAHIAEVDNNNEIKRLQESFIYLQRSINDYIKELRTTTAVNERIEGELNIARNIQLAMVPRNFPKNVSFSNDAGNEIRKYDIFADLRPAKEVGGDLYDFLVKNNTLNFAIGDVSGKGVPAAMFMAITRAAFRFLSGLDLTIDTVVKHINNSLTDGNESNMFCTLFAGRIDLATGKMLYCNAGHNPIIIVPPASSNNSKAFYLKAKPNLTMGLIADFEYFAEEINLEKGSKLLLYTDGVCEAENSKQELFGDDRLLQWAQTLNNPEKCNKTNEELIGDLYSTLKDFTKDNEQNDDITVMIISI